MSAKLKDKPHKTPRKETTMTTYDTRDEAIQHEIIEPLGEYAQEHDVDAIADKIIVWHDHLTPGGRVDFTLSGYQANPDEKPNFWDIVADNAL